MFQSSSPDVAAFPRQSPEPLLQPEQICQGVTACVALDFGLDEAVLMAPTRGAPRVAFARQVAMYLAHVGFALSFETVGRVFGRDRTTISHACHVIEDSRDDIWMDCRLAALELACRAASDAGNRVNYGSQRSAR